MRARPYRDQLFVTTRYIALHFFIGFVYINKGQHLICHPHFSLKIIYRVFLSNFIFQPKELTNKKRVTVFELANCKICKLHRYPRGGRRISLGLFSTHLALAIAQVRKSSKNLNMIKLITNTAGFLKIGLKLSKFTKIPILPLFVAIF